MPSVCAEVFAGADLGALLQHRCVRHRDLHQCPYKEEEIGGFAEKGTSTKLFSSSDADVQSSITETVEAQPEGKMISKDAISKPNETAPFEAWEVKSNHVMYLLTSD